MQQHKVETQILYEEQILEAIDQLRRRKARPDADRICNYLLRKFCVDARDTIADLHRLIEAEKVIQVDYKGNTSYRNASKWSRLQLYKNRPEGFVKDKLSPATVAGAVAELVIEEPDYLDQGVPPFRLIEQLLDGISNPTSRKMVEDFLNKEVASGNIIRSANGNYSLVATSDTSNTTLNSTISSSSSSSSPPPPPPPPSRANLITNNLMDNNEIITGSKKFPRDGTNGAHSENINVINNIHCNSNSGNGNINDSALISNSGESYNYDNNLLMTESRSSTPKINSPRPAVGSNNNNINNNNIINNNNNNNASIGTAVSKREQCFEVATAVKEPNSPEESVTKDDLSLCTEDNNAMATSIDTSEKKEPKTEVVNTSNLKRSSKSERKQRLMVRADDSMDIEIKFDEIKYESKFNDNTKEKTKEKEKEREREKDKDREDSENLSEKEDEEAEAERSSANPSPTLSNPVGGFRSARRKRAKKVFDPSDNNVVKRKRGRYATAATKASLQVTTQDSQDSTSSKPIVKETGRKCSLCYKDKAESLIPCRDCTVRAHPSCIYSPDDLLLKTGSSWQCERCKSCTVCCETSDIGPLLTCYTCDDAYHYSCHTPRVIRSGTKWQCCECKPQSGKQTVTTASSTAPTALTTSSTASTTPTASITTPATATAAAAAPRSETPPQTPTLPPVLSPQVSPSRESLEPTEDETIPRDSVIDPNIPDASDWTSEQVYQYFARLFPKEAEVFRMQDIDGHSLLLMKRSDVLIGLDLLLGPALKIYRHVLKLQLRRDETRFYWL